MGAISLRFAHAAGDGTAATAAVTVVVEGLSAHSMYDLTLRLWSHGQQVVHHLHMYATDTVYIRSSIVRLHLTLRLWSRGLQVMQHERVIVVEPGQEDLHVHIIYVYVYSR